THLARKWTVEDVENAEKFFATHNAGGTPFAFPKEMFLKFIKVFFFFCSILCCLDLISFLRYSPYLFASFSCDLTADRAHSYLHVTLPPGERRVLPRDHRGPPRGHVRSHSRPRLSDHGS